MNFDKLLLSVYFIFIKYKAVVCKFIGKFLVNEVFLLFELQFLLG